MTAEKKAFLKVNKFIKAEPGEKIFLNNLAEVTAEDNLKAKLKEIKIKEIAKKSGESVVIDVLEIIKTLKQEVSELEIEYFGESELVIEVVEDKSKSREENSGGFTWGLTIFVGIILFLGSGMAVMNFHADVSMSKVHQQIYELVMGEEKANPLLLQIPYSFGIACGMVIFFNGLFNLNLDDDPSPLEIEMYLYEDKVNNYLLDKKKKQAEEK